jgi:hypothetical protein
VSRDPTGGGPQLGSRARMQGGHVCNRHVPDIRARRSASSYGSQQPCWERDGRWHRRVRWMLPPRRSAVRRLPKAQWERERILPSRSASSLEAKKQPNHIYIYMHIHWCDTIKEKEKKKSRVTNPAPSRVSARDSCPTQRRQSWHWIQRLDRCSLFH